MSCVERAMTVSMSLPNSMKKLWMDEEVLEMFDRPTC